MSTKPLLPITAPYLRRFAVNALIAQPVAALRVDPVENLVDALVTAARFHGIELDRRDFRAMPGEETPSPAALATWLRESGLSVKAVRLQWRQLFRFRSDAPLVLLFSNGSARLLVAHDAAREVVFLKNPRAPPSGPPIPLDEPRLTQLWQGEVLLLRRLQRKRRPQRHGRRA